MTEVREMINDGITFENDTKKQLIAGLNTLGGTRLNLGCGNDYLEGWKNIDLGTTVPCDVKLNLDDHMLRLPWNDNGVDAIIAFHILEHIKELQQLKREIARVLRPDGMMVVVVPEFTSQDAWGDDTHCRAFSLHSFMPMYWPGLAPKEVSTLDVYDCWDNKNKWLLCTIRGK